MQIRIRELRKPDQNEPAHPSRVYRGTVKRLRGSIYTGRAMKTECTPHSKPSPETISEMATKAGYELYVVEVGK